MRCLWWASNNFMNDAWQNDPCLLEFEAEKPIRDRRWNWSRQTAQSVALRRRTYRTKERVVT
jgi:hypothetical protein